jgi:hypothetical protein
MTTRIIPDLPTGWQGVVYGLAVTLGLRDPTPGEKEAERERTELARQARPERELEAGG